MSESGQGNKKIDEMTRKLRRLDRRLTERWDKEWIHYFKESNPFVYFIHHEEMETMTSLKGKTAREVYQTKWQSQAQFGPLGELNIWAEEEQLAGKKLLEIGCGPGFLGKQLGKIAGSYIGIDYSQLALSIARRVSPPNCLYLPISELEKIFEHAGTVDMMVTRHFFIHNNYHNAMSVLNLAYALLKPLGTVSADFYMPNPARNPQPVRYPSKHELDPDLPSCSFLFSKEEIETIAREIGFRILSMHPHPELERQFVIFQKPEHGQAEPDLAKVIALRLRENAEPGFLSLLRSRIRKIFTSARFLRLKQLFGKGLRNPGLAARVLFKKTVLIFFRVLFWPFRILWPRSMRNHYQTWWHLASGAYGTATRGILEKMLPSIPRPAPGKPLKIFHGIYHTPQPVFIRDEFRRRGLKSDYETIDFNPAFPEVDARHSFYHADFYKEHVLIKDGLLMRKNPPVTTEENLRQLQDFFVERWSQYDIFQFNWFTSFLPDNMDVEFLRRSGRPVYFHFHGCFILDKLLPEFTQRGQSVADACRSCKARGWRRQYFERFFRGVHFASRVFTSSPNLCHCSEDFEYLPNSLEEKWDQFIPGEKPPGATLLIGHSRETVAGKKGTAEVVRAVEKLKQEGLPVELKLIENVSRETAMAQYGECDIFVEQLHSGSYGSAALEAMAQGVPVISSHHPAHAHLVPDCPVVHADPTTVEARLRELVVDEKRRKELGKKCFEFRLRFHSTKKVASHLLRIYQEDLEQRPALPKNNLANQKPYYGE